MINSEQRQLSPVSYTVLTFNQGPLMSLWRRRQNYSGTLKRDALALLVPIAATFAMILLFFYG